jgi:hypothetical protein
VLASGSVIYDLVPLLNFSGVICILLVVGLPSTRRRGRFGITIVEVRNFKRRGAGPLAGAESMKVGGGKRRRRGGDTNRGRRRRGTMPGEVIYRRNGNEETVEIVQAIVDVLPNLVQSLPFRVCEGGVVEFALNGVELAEKRVAKVSVHSGVVGECPFPQGLMDPFWRDA